VAKTRELRAADGPPGEERGEERAAGLPELEATCPECGGRGLVDGHPGWAEWRQARARGEERPPPPGLEVKSCPGCKGGKVPTAEGRALLDFLSRHLRR
jgi:hypothetical protein